MEALMAMEETARIFRVFSVNNWIFGAASWLENPVKITKLLAQLRKDYQYEVLIESLSIH